MIAGDRCYGIDGRGTLSSPAQQPSRAARYSFTNGCAFECYLDQWLIPTDSSGIGGIARLPISLGEQNIRLDWQSSHGVDGLLQSPQVDIGLESVNANINILLPESRWTLFTFGPQMGLAVLFWGVLLVVMMIAIGLGRTHQTPLKTYQWLLLGIGLSQTLIGVAILVVGWLFVMDWRQRKVVALAPRAFNAMQIGVGLLTLLAVLGLVGAVGFGLLGHPDMQISGNSSNAYHLKWYADQANEILPFATVISVPMWLYRILMLAWSLWLAFALLGWLKWSWQCFLQAGLWRAIPEKKPAGDSDVEKKHHE